MITSVGASSRSMRIVLAPVGSEGDLRPFLWLADKLAASGHRVRIAANPFYTELVAAARHPLLPAGDEEAMRRLLADERLWAGLEGSMRVMQGMIEQLAPCAAPFLEPGFEADLIIGSSFAIAASSAAEARNVPFVRMHLQPVAVRSTQAMPLLAPNLAWLRRMPAPVIRFFFRLVDLSLDSKPLDNINAFRRSLGLADWRSFYRDAFCGGDAACGLFPEWYAQPSADWPAHLRCFDFPLPRREAVRPLPEEVRRFLEAGEAPVVWTHGSANLHTGDFGRQAERCCRELGVRGILVASAEVPGADADSGRFLRIAYAPFESLFPQCRAVVHHGGVGTMAEALKAGVPQLVVPLAHDQFDNADRAERLGFGLAQQYGKLARIAPRLRRLLDHPEHAARAREYGAKIGDSPDIVPWLEAVHAKKNGL